MLLQTHSFFCPIKVLYESIHQNLGTEKFERSDAQLSRKLFTWSLPKFLKVIQRSASKKNQLPYLLNHHVKIKNAIIIHFFSSFVS